MEPPPTLEGLVKEVCISLHLLDQKCSDEHLKSISLFLDWRSVAPHLGLSERDIEDVEVEKKTEPERRLKVLQKWKRKYGYMATFRKLVEVLLVVVGNADDAERVCRLLQTPTDTGESSTSRDANFPVDEQQSSMATVSEPTKQLPHPVVEVSKSPVQPLECDIEKEIEELEDQFLDVVDEAASSLENVPLSKIKRCVTQLRVSVKYQHKKFLEDKLSAIDAAQSVGAVFAILGLYWDFLNCGLLTELVRRLGNDETKLLMLQYTEKLRQFRMKTKLGDFMDKWARSTPPQFVEFITEMGDNWKECTLEDLEEFRNQLARSMYVEEYALRIKSTKPGSVFITWALPSSFPGIADTLQSAFEVLQKHGVLRIIFQGKCIPDTSPKSLTSTERHVMGETKHTHEESPPMTPSTAALLLPTPPEMSQQDTKQKFDMITALLGAGVPHIVEEILQSLDVKSLVKSEQVSSTWRDVIADLRIWKHLIKHNVDSNPLWRALFKRRGWYKYLDMPPAKQISRQFYRQLHHRACRDIRSLEANRRKGHYTFTRVETGSRVLCLQYDHNKIVTGHLDHTIKIWDRSTLQLLKVLAGHKAGVRCLQCYEKVVISGSNDRTVKVWNIKTGQVINDLLHHKGTVNSLKFTTDTLVTGCDDETVTVWNMKSPTDITLRMILKGHERFVSSVDLSETTIISGSHDGTIKVWDSSSGELLRTLRGHSSSVHCLQLLGSHLISGSDDMTMRIWNVDTGECMQVLHGHHNLVSCVAVDNKRIVSGSYKTIKVWDLAAALDTGSSSDTLCITTLKEHSHWVRAIQFDDFQVISGSYDGTLLIHDFLDPTPPILRT